MINKKIIFRVAFLVQVLIFSGWYVWGKDGLVFLQRIRHQNNVLAEQVNALEQEVDDLSMNICAVKTEDFFKEKIARQQLQMARADETIYIVD